MLDDATPTEMQLEPERRYDAEQAAFTIARRFRLDPAAVDVEPREYTAGELSELVKTWHREIKSGDRAVVSVEWNDGRPVSDDAVPVTDEQIIGATTELDQRLEAELAAIAEQASQPEPEPEPEPEQPPATTSDDARDFAVMTAAEQWTERNTYVARWGIRAWRVRLEAMEHMHRAHLTRRRTR